MASEVAGFPPEFQSMEDDFVECKIAINNSINAIADEGSSPAAIQLAQANIVEAQRCMKLMSVEVRGKAPNVRKAMQAKINLYREELELLVTGRELGSADAWRLALSAALSSAEEDGEELQATSATKSYRPLVLEAIEQIVPHLADYKTFSENVYGVLEFCEQECSHELVAVVGKWLGGCGFKTPMDVAFRRWLYEYMDAASEKMLEVNARGFKQALLLAALKEEDATLKLPLLQLIDCKIGSLEGVIVPSQPPLSKPMRLLAFYWQNARQLSLSTVLCATKFSGVVATNSVDAEAVLTFLRWAREFEPLFFDNFSELTVEMKIFPRIRHQDLQLPSTISHFIETTSPHRTRWLRQLQASQQQVREAFERKALHIQLPSESKVDETHKLKLPWSSDALGYLCHELTVLHKHVFPDALAVYATIAASLLSSPTEEIDLETVATCVQGLFSVAAIRSDAESLFLLLAAVIDLRCASHPMWLMKPQLFERTVEDLSEQFISETDSTRKWIQQVLLFQLLLMCDATLLTNRERWLEERLPSSVFCIVRNRFKP